MISLEIWSYELMVLLAGLLPNPKLETSVLSISLNTATLIYMVPLGLSGAVSTRVSNELGAKQSHRARFAVRIAVCLVLTEAILVATVMILGRKVWGYCYSTEEEVVKYVGKMMFLLAASHISEGIQSVLAGAIRGCGWQKIGAFVNLGAYYLMGIPTGVLLAFVFHIGGKGLWMGVMVAAFMQAVFFSIITLCADWEKEVQKATGRVYKNINQEDALR
ncbi:Protein DETOXIFICATION [Quillaja saponaria]|uniref:Protein DETOXIFICATION n=1 Tax=Quillaja saponaria TaxID=32244 RepID=A0AAD7PWL0_QUISA|nr:Protein DETOXIFICATION [Quillaja saponaria]